jgi:hypothetical protein
MATLYGGRVSARRMFEGNAYNETTSRSSSFAPTLSNAETGEVEQRRSPDQLRRGKP